MHDDFAVRGRLEDRTLADELVPHFAGIHQIAVVTERQLSVRAVDDNRLRVDQTAFTGSRIPDVAHGGGAGELRQRVFVESLVDVAHRLRHANGDAVGGGNARALLTPMLQCVQAEVGEVGSLADGRKCRRRRIPLETYRT